MKHGDGSQTGEVLPDPEDAKKKQQTKWEQGTRANKNVGFSHKEPFLCPEASNEYNN